MPRAQYIPLAFEPGLWKNGPLYQAQGRWYDADLMRWANVVLGLLAAGDLGVSPRLR